MKEKTLCNRGPCIRRRLVGNYCIKCFVNKKAFDLGIHKYKWFTYHRQWWEDSLKGRYLAIYNGIEPGSRYKYYSKMWKTQKKIRVGALRKIDKLVSRIDKAARKDRERAYRNEEIG